ncbi:hypothetical protein M8C21_016557 [Ambrosia artemisiifolia]|uniref:Ubiquitin-specific protease family C19-related protein n=1 Tax=Ambrosia artemisiifolia TaxID=4212 RepID=A0AAD5CI84_AMBAR|nr:hypothetical protein M8C21_016557 [Ambrosia artemisiifolia]
MGTRVPSHQLSNGLYVSGQPDHPTPGSPPVLTTEPITPIKTSGSDPVPNQSGSGQMIQLQPTGLITSRSLEMSGENGSGRAGDPDPAGKTVYGSSVTTLGYDEVWLLGVRGWRRLMWVLVVVGLLVGGLVTVVVKKAVVVVVVVTVLVVVMVVVMWNCGWKKRGLLGYLKKYPDDELRGAVDGQFVKITGIVTCGSIPLESSFQKVERCVYVSTELFEHKRGTWKLGIANHCCFSWGCSNSEKYVADFYISDSRSGLRALVKAGYGAKVAPFVKEATVVDITKEKRELSPRFLEWLADRSLSNDDRIMRLKEGYIKEGSTVSVMGVVRRHDNVLMIVPPIEPMSTGCRWFCGLLPTYVEGLVLTCDESQSADVLPV